MKKTDFFRIEGMTCSGCERTVSRVIGNIEGVQSAKADLNAAGVEVEYDPQQVTVDQIRSAVNGIGYKFADDASSN